ncbi:hypothetical protein Aab01nite_49310 [Paractinoplanes abujensis]|nr:hypothetical protein Aab01nite_49310 [Actinoplanes abujensis]
MGGIGWSRAASSVAAWKLASPSTKARAPSSSSARQPGLGKGPVAVIHVTGSFWPASARTGIGRGSYIAGMTPYASLHRRTDAGPGRALLASQRPLTKERRHE